MGSTVLLQRLLLVSLLALPIAASQINVGLSTGTNQLLTYQTSGPSAPISFQRINDSSFETGIAPWTEIDYNNHTSGLQTIQIVHPGLNDNSAIQLTVNSGNLTIDSHVTLLQDLSRNPVAFGNSLRLRASIQSLTLQGSTTTDRVEISLTLASSIGNNARIHYVLASGSSLPTNTTSDGYLAATGTSSSGWTLLDRNVATDAATIFPALFTILTSVKDVRLSVYSTSQSTPTYDPRIKYYETGGDSYWNTTEYVVYDPDSDGTYDNTRDTVLYNGTTPVLPPLPNQVPLVNDQWIKFVDTNLNGQWDPGEAIVYDWHHDGVYDYNSNPTDPTICGSPPLCGPPIVGSLLQDPVREQTKALFDQVELYSTNGNYDWIHNGGFETGDLNGWGNTAGFIAASNLSHSGTFSSLGSAAGTTIDLAQSIDGRPAVDSSTRLLASGYIGSMTGGSSSDRADVWLGLVDSSPQANPLAIYYYFKTGTGTLPSNTTDTVNHKVAGFGSFFQWLSLNQSLLPETGYFDVAGYTAPYRIETIGLETSAQTSSTTTAYFDDISTPAFYTPTPAVSTYYAADGINSTYAYSAARVPQGSFYLSVPAGQSVLNITSPANTILQASDYTTQTVAGTRLITVPISTSLKYASLGDWRFYATSQNALTSLYATATGSNNPTSNFNGGSSSNLVSQSKDPLGSPLSNSNVTFIFYSSSTQAFNGRTNNQGWYNQTNVALPQNAGTNILEAITVSSSYIGLRTAQLTINSAFPWAIIGYASIIGAALVLFCLFYLRSRRDRSQHAVPLQSSIRNLPGPAATDKNKLAAMTPGHLEPIA